MSDSDPTHGAGGPQGSTGQPSTSDGDVRDDSAVLWSLFLRTHAAVVRTLDRELTTATGLPLSWYDVLLELAAAPGHKLRMRELGERVVLSRSRVSRVVDELVRRSLVVREADPGDRRAWYATLTEAGREALRTSAPVYLAGIARHFTAHLSPEERDAMRSGLHRVLAAQEDLEAREAGRPRRLPIIPR